MKRSKRLFAFSFFNLIPKYRMELSTRDLTQPYITIKVIIAFYIFVKKKIFLTRTINLGRIKSSFKLRLPFIK